MFDERWGENQSGRKRLRSGHKLFPFAAQQREDDSGLTDGLGASGSEKQTGFPKSIVMNKTLSGTSGTAGEWIAVRKTENSSS